MSDLANNALIDVGEYMTLIGQPEDAEVDPNKFVMHINAASTAIEKYVNRKICPSSSATELYDGSGYAEIFLRQMRATSVTTMYYWSSSAWQEMTTTAYPRELDTDRNRIRLTDGKIFADAKDYYKFVYVYGYNREDVPDDIKLACALLVKHNLLQVDKAGIASESFGDVTTSYLTGGIPSSVKILLAPYRRLSLG